MRFFEEKIGKFVEKWTVTAKEVAEKEVSKTMNANFDAIFEAARVLIFGGIAFAGAVGLELLGGSKKEKNTYPRKYKEDTKTYTINITNNYYREAKE